MTNINFSYETAAHLLINLRDYTPSDWDALGITPSDFKVYAGPIAWKAEQMYQVMRTFDAIMHGTLRLLNLPPVEVPVEYQAAVIVGTIHPCNRIVCCSWMAQHTKIGAGAVGASQRAETGATVEPMSQRQLIAMVFLLGNHDGAEQSRSLMLTKFGINTKRAQEQEKIHGAQGNQGRG